MASHFDKNTSRYFGLKAVALSLLAVSSVNALFEEDAGKEDWALRTIGDITHTSCTRNGDVCFVGTSGGTLAALNMNDGGVNWRRLQESSAVVSQVTYVHDKVVTVSSVNGESTLIRAWDVSGELVWAISSPVGDRPVVLEGRRGFVTVHENQLTVEVDVQTGVFTPLAAHPSQEQINAAKKLSSVDITPYIAACSQVHKDRGVLTAAWRAGAGLLGKFADDSVAYLRSGAANCEAAWVREEGLAFVASAHLFNLGPIATALTADGDVAVTAELPRTALEVLLNPIAAVSFLTHTLVSTPKSILEGVSGLQNAAMSLLSLQNDKLARKKNNKALGMAGVLKMRASSLEYSNPIIAPEHQGVSLVQAALSVSKALGSDEHTFGREEVALLTTRKGAGLVVHLASGKLIHRIPPVSDSLLTAGAPVAAAALAGQAAVANNGRWIPGAAAGSHLAGVHVVSQATGEVVIHVKEGGKDELVWVNIFSGVVSRRVSPANPCASVRVLDAVSFLPKPALSKEAAELIAEHPIVCLRDSSSELLSSAPFDHKYRAAAHTGKAGQSVDHLTLLTQSEQEVEALQIKLAEGEQRAAALWRSRVAPGEKLLHLATPLHAELPYAPLHVHHDASVSYKLPSSELLVALVKHGVDALEPFSIRALHGSTGRLLWERRLPSHAAGPVHVAVCENFAVATYSNSEAHRTDVLVVDSFRGNVMSDPMKIVTSSIADETRMSFDVSARARSFAMPITAVSALGVTSTRTGVTSRSILMSLPSGHFIQVPRSLLSPMRMKLEPGQKPDAAPQDGLPPMEQAVVPVIWQQMSLSHVRELAPARTIVSLPTERESSTLAIAIGQDIFLSAFQPSATRFDSTPHGFNPSLVILCMIVLFGVAVVSSGFAEKKKAKQLWK